MTVIFITNCFEFVILQPCRHFCELVHDACVEEITGLKSFLKVINYEPVEIVFNCSILPDTVAGDLPQCFMPIMRQQNEGSELISLHLPQYGHRWGHRLESDLELCPREIDLIAHINYTAIITLVPEDLALRLPLDVAHL